MICLFWHKQCSNYTLSPDLERSRAQWSEKGLHTRHGCLCTIISQKTYMCYNDTSNHSTGDFIINYTQLPQHNPENWLQMSSRGELTLSVWQICPPITAHKKSHAEMWTCRICNNVGTNSKPATSSFVCLRACVNLSVCLHFATMLAVAEYQLPAQGGKGSLITHPQSLANYCLLTWIDKPIATTMGELKPSVGYGATRVKSEHRKSWS